MNSVKTGSCVYLSFLHFLLLLATQVTLNAGNLYISSLPALFFSLMLAMQVHL